MVNLHKMNFVLILHHIEYDDVMMIKEIFVEIYYLLRNYFLMEMLNVDEQFLWEMKNVEHVYVIYLGLGDCLIIMIPIFIKHFFK